MFDFSDPRQPLPKLEIHTLGCDCALCCAMPPAHPSLTRDAERTAILMMIGMATGVVITWAIDWVIAGPGLRVMVGL